MADSRINHQDARTYWQGIDADVNGMLGGFPRVSKVDLQGSKNILAKLDIGGSLGKKVERAVDCGAGIGRVTKNVLLSVAETVDIVEPISKFTDKLQGIPGVGKIYNVGLEEWAPEEELDRKYDLMWHQWCVGHLTDTQLTTHLRKCVLVLKEGGWIVVKENLTKSDEDIFDEIDSSVTRADKKFRQIFEDAGLSIKKTENQKGLPFVLYPVKTYVLQPK